MANYLSSLESAALMDGDEVNERVCFFCLTVYFSAKVCNVVNLLLSDLLRITVSATIDKANVNLREQHRHLWVAPFSRLIDDWDLTDWSTTTAVRKCRKG